MKSIVIAAALASSSAANAPVAEFALDRYLGTWHEAAHLPMFFQRNCKDQTTAQYSRLADGSIEVRNRCRTRSGEIQEAVGRARATARPAALEVRFAPAWLSWVPGIWADYWVVDLDQDYRWAVVGSPSRKYLWVLSREPGMQRALYREIVQRAKDRGYDVDRLVETGVQD
ncbi:lipocalin family protein [Lysobacter enzymogenes]|uniref:lipocalin family protein n=1 Tax=Lysobacter enzymogenes TaxID=69 RepID=UPI001AF6D93D|nr:lipocalin family protein [Lysobacter enzymogenes]QQQ00863.1 lipocalin family protein [Lysobacter enzymogenes]